MSAYCNLAGLYPPEGSQVWSTEIKWQPIPVHTRPYDMDPVGRICVSIIVKQSLSFPIFILYGYIFDLGKN